MATNSVAPQWYFFSVILICGVHLAQCSVVTYDRKALVINGQRKILFSGSIHYPRSTPQMWEGLIQKAKDGGLNVIDTYVFWNLHEPSPNNYNFEGRYDLVGFIKLVHKAGLYVHLRIGPYICAEWNFGGFPVWLKFIEGISFRTNNEPFKREMQRFTQKIVQMMKDEKLFQSQGGPIILSQIENEFKGNSEVYDDHAYVTWAAKMAVELGTGVPWVMCKEDDAPDPIINTCNNFYCDSGFSPNQPYKPLMWTEAWGSWFNEFGGPSHTRPVEDLAFAVARFIRKGGSFVNYYMYHGGTNFGRTAGGPFITTSYDYDAPLDEYGEKTANIGSIWLDLEIEFQEMALDGPGKEFLISISRRLIREPKYSHLKDLHSAVKQCEWALVSADPTIKQFGSYEQAHIFYPESGGCAAFLTNYHQDSAATVTFNNKRYELPPWSISILPDCKRVVYNTAEVRVQPSEGKFSPTGTQLTSWKNFVEDIAAVESDSKITFAGLEDQLSITRDASDYLWYSTSVEISPNEPFLHGGQRPTLSVTSEGDLLHVFINGQLSGTAYGSSRYRQFTFEGNANLHAGTNKISLLSVSVGLLDNGRHVEAMKTGIHGPVVLNGVDGNSRDLSRQKWSYKVGLIGEAMNLFSREENSFADWSSESLVVQNQRSLTWYKAHFDAPGGDNPLALDMGSMGKGQVWINGQSIGRYWTIYAKGNCSICSYVGTYRPTKCQSGCGQPSQRWYHVPRAWLRSTQNLLVVFEEFGGDVSKISLVERIY